MPTSLRAGSERVRPRRQCRRRWWHGFLVLGLLGGQTRAGAEAPPDPSRPEAPSSVSAPRRHVDRPPEQEPWRVAPTIVTAHRAPRESVDVPAAVTVVDHPERQTPRTFPDLLRGRTGVFVQETTPGQAAPIVRGLIGSSILMLVDGFRLNSTIFRPAPNQYFALIDPYHVDRVEVVRGPSSTLYGSDAMGGVVQVFTPEPRFSSQRWETRGAALGQFSSADLGEVARFSLQTGRRGIGVSAGFTLQNHNDLRTGRGGGVQRPSGYGAYAGDATLFLERGRHEGLVAVQYLVQPRTPRYDELVPGFGQTEPNSEVFFFEPNDRLAVRARYRLSAPLPHVDQLELQVGFQRIRDDRRTRDLGSRDELRECNRSDLGGLVLRLESALRSWVRLTYGAELYVDDVGSRSTREDIGTGAVTPRAGRFADGSVVASLGLYLQSEFRLGRYLSAVAGGRFSYFRIHVPAADRGVGAELSFPDVTGNLGLVVHLSPLVHLVSNVGRGFRAPNIFDLSSLGPRPGNRFQIPNPALRSEQVVTVDLGLRLLSRRFSFEAVGFFSDFRDRIEAVPTGETTETGREVVQSRNINRVLLAGVEVGGRVRLMAPLEFFGSLNYTFGEERFLDGSRVPADRIPPINGRAGLYYQVLPRLWMESYVRFAGAQRRLSLRDRDDPRIDPLGTPGWYAISVRLGVQLLERLGLRVLVDNLLDRRYREHGSGIDAAGVNAVVSADVRF